ncbi:N-methyl-L-tryptophan oxidase [Quadrisphaera setariae]|uniref:N-methyl-L-tryptophan oxidase n=1 Tax=Quadrisphaera setariae TaxID=2593304 RepID=A0A5C8ZDF2_9ACTN|nr:N-methyl-L-tryptophan oxidase [Quadrisphaera setariae]TXR55514.1 N-methyl-L-tryptophan oxidase [Quadrisphaera setariae]
MELDADVAVVGLGAMGSATAWRLAARGVDVVGIEKHRPGHVLGSSHGGTRLFRTLCMEHPHLVDVARESARLWRELEASSGTELLRLSGGLMLGPRGGHVIEGTRRAAAAAGVELHDLTRSELAARWPQHAGLGPDDVGLFDEQAGVLHPEHGVQAACAAAEATGATLLLDTGVSRVELVDQGAVVETAARRIRVRQVVVTAGPWLGELVAGMPLEVVRTPMTWFAPRAGVDASTFSLERFPIFIRESADGSVAWGHGAADEHGVKVGPEDDPAYRRTRPDDCDRAVTPADSAHVSRVVAASLPGLDPTPSRVTTCMVTRSPDMQFQLGRPHGDPRLVVGGGCSGHAFKHATGIGESLARAVVGEEPFVDLGFADVNRFL